MILNFNIREYLNKKFISPDDFILSEKPISDFDFSLDLNQFSDFISFAHENKKDLVKNTYFEFVNDVLFDNEEGNWGSYYPRYEVVINDDGFQLIPFDFVSTEKPKLMRRHKIERLIKYNVRLETELKGLRKAVLFLINKVSELYKEDLSKSAELESFINNNTYITNIISQFPKENEKDNGALIEGYAWLKTKHIPNSLP